MIRTGNKRTKIINSYLCKSTMKDLFFIALLNVQTFDTQGPVTIIARNDPNLYFIQGPVIIITR